MAQNVKNGNGNLAVGNIDSNSLTSNPIAFQYTDIWKGEKPKGEVFHYKKDWKTASSLESFIEKRNAGLSTRLCVKDLDKSEKGNSKQDISSSAGFFIDGDGDMTIGQLKQTELWQYVAFIQPSCSFVEGTHGYLNDIDTWRKFHAYIFFDKPSLTDYTIHEKITAYCFKKVLGFDCIIVDKNGNQKVDTGVFDAGRIDFFSKQKIVEINLDARLPLVRYFGLAEAWEEETQASKKVKSKKSNKKNVFPKATGKESLPESNQASSTQTLTNYELSNTDVELESSTFTDLIHNWLWEEVIINACDGDVREFFNYYYDFKFKERATDKVDGDCDVVKYDGFNPFSDTNSSGNSFTVAVLENGVINWYDRSNNAVITNQDDSIKAGGSPIDFVYQYKKEYQNLYEHGTPQDNFIAVVMGIANDFGVPCPDLKIGFKWLYNQLCRDFKAKLYRSGWESKSDRSYYYIFNPAFGIWQDVSLHNLTPILVRHVESNYPEAELRILSQMDEKEVKSYAKKGLSGILSAKFKNYGGSKDTELLSHPLDDYEYLAFNNGLWNHRTQKLEENKGQAFNRAYLPFNYELVDDSNPVIVAYKDLINTMFDNDVDRELALSWHIMAVTNKAGLSNHLFGVSGVSNTFKSTYGIIIKNMFGKMAMQFKTEDIFNPNNSHALAQLENLRAFNIQELKHDGKNKDLTGILDYFGNASSETITINPKFQPAREIPRNFAFTFDYEGDNLQLPFGKTGYYRRIVTVKTKSDFPKSDKDKLISYIKPGGVMDLKSSKKMQTLLCWMIQQNRDEAVNKFDELKVNDRALERQRDSLAESDTVYAFTRECIDVDNNNETKQTFAVIFEYYKVWCGANDYDFPVAKKTFSTNFKKYLTNELLGFDWKGTDKKSNSKIVYRGLKLNDEKAVMLDRERNKQNGFVNIPLPSDELEDSGKSDR